MLKSGFMFGKMQVGKMEGNKKSEGKKGERNEKGRKGKRDSKGVIRVIEAVVGVLLVLLGLIYFVSQQTKTLGKEEKAREVLRFVLAEIEKNATMREYILQEETYNLNQSLKQIFSNIAPQYEFSFCFAEPESVCKPAGIPDKDVYADSLFVSSFDGQVNATKLMLFVWRK
jgi:hypothetical protein